MPPVWIAIGLAVTALAPIGTTLGVVTAVSTALDIVASVAIGIGTAVTVADALKSPTPEGLHLTLRQPIPPRRRGCGITRLGGFYLMDVANGKNDLQRVVAFCDGVVGNLRRHYLAQDAVVVIGGVVQKMLNGAYPTSVAAFETTFGVTGVPAFPGWDAGTGVWPATSTGTGIFMGATHFFGGSDASYPTDFPRGPSEANIVGEVNVAFDWRDETQSQTDPTTWKNTTNPIVALVHEMWCFRGDDWALDYLPNLAGLTAEANVCDAAINYLNIFTQAVVFSGQDANHVNLDASGPTPPNGTTIYVGSQAVVVSGSSSVTVDGVPCTQVTWGGAGLLAGLGQQQQVRWQATPTHPATESTYAVGGAWNVDEPVSQTIKKFLDAMDGWMIRRPLDGAWVIRSGHYYPPTVTIGPDEVINYTWEPFIQAGKVITEIDPAFVAPAWDYKQIDTDPWGDEAAQAIYGVSSQEFKPDFVQSNGQVRRLAKRRLSRLLAHTETIKLKASGFRAIGERYITLALGGSETEDLQNVVVEIVGAPEIVDNGMAVIFPIAPADPTIDAWDCYTDEGTGPATTAAAPVLELVAPTVTDVEPFTQTHSSGGAGLGERLHVFITPPDVTVAGLTWWLQWQVLGDTNWTAVAPSYDLAAGDVEIDTGFVPTGSAILVQARYQTGGGKFSPWSASLASDHGLITTAGVELAATSGEILAETSAASSDDIDTTAGVQVGTTSGESLTREH
jgi:hypothetical protein